MSRPVDVEEYLRLFLAADQDRRRDAARVLLGEAVVPKHRRGPLLMNFSDAAALLGVSRPTLYRMIEASQIERVEILPGRYRICIEDIERLITRREVGHK